MKLTDYQTLLFDCDGVVLNSNRVKTEAFYHSALPYGKKAAKALVDYHVSRGGISRYLKFTYFLTDILGKGKNDNELNALLNTFAVEVKKGLLNCDVAYGLKELRENTEGARWLIVSGGVQDELREIFARRGLAAFFDGGIFGSPATKDQILAEQLSRDNIKFPALFFGDSKYDLQAAHGAGLDFVFISEWSEVLDWQAFCQQNNTLFFSRLSALNTCCELK
jgi:phosphoglycolate phosphatase-like HAD superfamily hydrolase